MKTFTRSANGRSRTPRETFDAMREMYASIQTRLGERMVARAAQFARNENRWDFIGDEARALECLALALAALGDRSAVDELGIEY